MGTSERDASRILFFLAGMSDSESDPGSMEYRCFRGTKGAKATCLPAGTFSTGLTSALVTASSKCLSASWASSSDPYATARPNTTAADELTNRTACSRATSITTGASYMSAICKSL